MQDTEGGTRSPLMMFLVALVVAALLAATLMMTAVFAAKPTNPGPPAGKEPPATAGPPPEVEPQAPIVAGPPADPGTSPIQGQYCLDEPDAPECQQ
jgi:hypothetical protein